MKLGFFLIFFIYSVFTQAAVKCSDLTLRLKPDAISNLLRSANGRPEFKSRQEEWAKRPLTSSDSINSDSSEEIRKTLFSQVNKANVRRLIFSNTRYYLKIFIADKILLLKDTSFRFLFEGYISLKESYNFMSIWKSLSAVGGEDRKLHNNESIRKRPFDLVGSNENVSYFSDFLKNQKSKGGTYIGVGHEQNYDLILSSQADYAILYDYDPRVILAHRVVQIAVENTKTIGEFKELFENEEKLIDLVKRNSYANEPLDTYLEYSLIFKNSWLGKLSRSSFLKDEGHFQKLKNMYRSNRIFHVLGDNSGDVFNEISKIQNKIQSKIQTLYVSNAFELDWTKEISDTTIKGLNSLDLAKDANLIFTNSYDQKDINEIIQNVSAEMSQADSESKAELSKWLSNLNQNLSDAKTYFNRMLIDSDLSNSSEPENNHAKQIANEGAGQETFQYYHLSLRRWLDHLGAPK